MPRVSGKKQVKGQVELSTDGLAGGLAQEIVAVAPAPKPRARRARRAGLPARWPAALVHPPRSVEELVVAVREVFGVRVPRRAVRSGSDAPLAYLVHSFFEGRLGVDGQGKEVDLKDAPLPPDCVVWAARGGGKTFLGALATALDLIYKPGIEVRILGGSLEQSKRMHAHLVDLLTREGVSAVLKGKPTARGVKLKNGSCAEVLAQSESSVRGTRVQKLRCDEVDLFDRQVWDAAQLTTRSLNYPGPWGEKVAGAIHSSSTMHVPMGLMWELVEQARPPVGRGGGAQESKAERVAFRWGVVDALEACAQSEDCTSCALWNDCAGEAKKRSADEAGHVGIDDARRMKGRVSLVVWESEMLCLRPRVTGSVFPEFDWTAHVLGQGRVEEILSNQPRVVRKGDGQEDRCALAWPIGGLRLVAGMDFGLRAPTVILWGVVDSLGVLTIIDEYVHTGRTIAEHVGHIKASPLGLPEAVWCDPAGHARNDQTGVSAIGVMVAAGVNAKGRGTGIAEGIEALRARLAPAAGGPTLRISASCTHLLKSLLRYRYNERDPSDEVPMKDGSDHAVDALRYLVMGLEGSRAGERRYA